MGCENWIFPVGTQGNRHRGTDSDKISRLPNAPISYMVSPDDRGGKLVSQAFLESPFGRPHQSYGRAAKTRNGITYGRKQRSRSTKGGTASSTLGPPTQGSGGTGQRHPQSGMLDCHKDVNGGLPASDSAHARGPSFRVPHRNRGSQILGQFDKQSQHALTLITNSTPTDR